MKIALLGDSLTQGYGLAPEDGLVPQMQSALRGRGADVILVNAGVSGDTTAGGLSRIDWTLGPDISGVVVILGGNDMLRAIPPEVSRANLDQIVSHAREAGASVMLVAMQAPQNYGAEYKAAFDTMYGEIASSYGLQSPPFFFEGLGTDLPNLQDFFQRDGIHPNAKGVARIVEGLMPDMLRFVDDLGGCSDGCSAE